ncbi:MAG: C40 family peptidase [Bacteroidota bacterium]
MEYAVVAVPAAPVRRKARHQNEMVSQLLFGEMVKIIRTKGSLWVKVRSLHDDYEGWMTHTLLKEVNEREAKKISDHAASDLLNTILVNEKKMHIPFGASLPGFDDGKGRLNDIGYNFTGNYIKRSEVSPGTEKVQQLTTPWLNAPYMWGGRTILGVDCSGFVQVNYKMMGIDLPRDAWQQAQRGVTVKKLKEAVCGDLAFFDDKEEIVHVGILLNDEQIIHASGKVRIDTIDKKGIINSDTGRRTHFLKSIKRYW